MLISYLQANRASLRPVYSLPPNLERLDRETLERLKERTQKRIEDLELSILALDGIILDCIKRQDQLGYRIPLASQPSYKEELIEKYEKVTEEKKIRSKEYQELKHEIATLNYNLEQLDIVLNTILQEIVDLSDS
ncbi:hypothetical protein NTE_00106 [Candidatus Nitrososphaera evergladensis SR1]|jgi:hypothetical protein|uniref:Uncharacterized protein n=1 Tax=Candidatus Nitrososphaera evergladensis SR1 TaxID=1459636 RepID=A0A075MLN3_9ARCH|nr:DUF342 domain-containing protein [Candidatus Nitrososphaera evergladensis]AIF82188.1 hypothetical protein NTE_00106 [Candidatus Nitrososphaera evergladensis SR1]